ncbi:MAG: NAD(P)H-dependent oxidoreductase [Deltaproteobacteria bacterium]|nr:NAD(P)H-dependent oxidoreductase [Deltaproteobacteria bacterium]
MPRRILVYLAHPVLERSRVNRTMIDAVRDLPGVTVRDLYEDYPTLAIDVAREQADLLAHDVIVFQHPFYWYSTPALLKEWQDLVLEYGWAYGEGGKALAGKLTFNCVSTGGPQAAYQPEGYNRFTIRQLLAPWDQTAHLCGMKFLAPFVVHASLRFTSREEIAPHAANYRRVLEALRDDRFDTERAAYEERMTDALDGLISPIVRNQGLVS